MLCEFFSLISERVWALDLGSHLGIWVSVGVAIFMVGFWSGKVIGDDGLQWGVLVVLWTIIKGNIGCNE